MGNSTHSFGTRARLALAVVALGSTISGPLAAQTDSGRTGSWQFHLSPYLWASGITGDMGVRGNTVHVDVGFRTLLENLDATLTLAGVAMRDGWGAGFEVNYVSLSVDRATPGPLFDTAEADVEQLMLEVTGRRRLLTARPVNVDFLAGSRYWRWSGTLDLTEGVLEPVSFSDTQTWFDPIVGLSAVAEPAPRFLVQGRADIGGFDVGSRLTWQALGLVGYRFADHVDVRIGYRYLDVDYTNDGFTFDVAMAGLITGVVFSF